MNASQAEAVADYAKGGVWCPMGGVWLVVVPKNDGTLVVFSRGGVRHYLSEADFEAGQPHIEIDLDDED